MVNIAALGNQLIQATEHEKISDVKELLKQGALPNSTKDLKTPLWYAAHRNQVEIMRELIAAGADVDARDGNQQTPLYAAAWIGHVDAVRVLLDANAEVDAVAYNTKFTPLIAAASGGHLEIVEMLLKAGADISIKGEWSITNWNALEAAEYYGHEQVTEYLRTISEERY